jgi:3-methylcrotonyl-CoA carboxylase alpha subunit
MTDPVSLTSDGGRWVAQVEGDRITVDDRAALVVRDEGDGRLRVEGDGRSILATFAVAGESIWIGVDGHAIEFRVDRSAYHDRAAGHDDDMLRPPMSATVVRIAVQPGAQVQAGDTLLVLEAMKMELPIQAPRAGTVRAIHCAEGQLVQPETLLVEIE